LTTSYLLISLGWI